MTDRLETAKMLKEDAEIAEDTIRRAELMADHYRIMSEETEGFESARYKQEMYNQVGVLSEAKHPDADPEVIKHKAFEDYLISTHDITEGCVEGDEIKFVPVMENLADLGIELVESEIGQMHRVQMNGILNEDKADFHLFQSSATGEFTIRMLGEGNSDLVKSFVEMATMPICEDIEKFDAWKKEVEQKNAEHAGKIKYVGKAENGANHVSAEIPTDKGPRSLGFYDMNSNEGHHLSEELAEAFMVHVDDGRDYGDEPDERDASHVISGAKKHEGEFSGHSDKGTYFKFASKSNAEKFIRHVSQSPRGTTHASLTEGNLQEDAQETDVLETSKGKVYRVDDRPDKLWYSNEDMWNEHTKKINDTQYNGELKQDTEGKTSKLIDPNTDRTVALFNSDIQHGWVVSDHENVIKESLELVGEDLVEDYELSRKNMSKRSHGEGEPGNESGAATEAVEEEAPDEVEKKKKWEDALKAVDELGASMKKSGAPTGSNYPAWNEKHKTNGLKESEAIIDSLDVLAEGLDKDFKQCLESMISAKVAEKFSEMKLTVAKAM